MNCVHSIPGLDLARLAIGSEVRVAKASPRALLAIRPTVSGGASFPALPPLPGMENGGAARESNLHVANERSLYLWLSGGDGAVCIRALTLQTTLEPQLLPPEMAL